MKTIKLFLVSVAVFGASFCLYVISAGGTVEPKGLFEQKCQQCHELDIPRSQQLDRSGWQGIMSWMTSMTGANISDQEAAIILDYLVEKHGP